MLDSLLDDILVAPFETRAARAYGPLRLAHQGRNKDALDKLIASHAMSLGITLVTNNEAVFRKAVTLQKDGLGLFHRLLVGLIAFSRYGITIIHGSDQAFLNEGVEIDTHEGNSPFRRQIRNAIT